LWSHGVRGAGLPVWPCAARIASASRAKLTRATLHAPIAGSFLRRRPLPSSPSSLAASVAAASVLASPGSASAIRTHTGSSAPDRGSAPSPAAAFAASAPGDAGVVAGPDTGGGFGAAAPEQDTRTAIARLRQIDMVPSSGEQRGLIRRYSARAPRGPHFCRRSSVRGCTTSRGASPVPRATTVAVSRGRRRRPAAPACARA
jgi:hypothetical protein